MTDGAASPPASATRERHPGRTPQARWGWLIGYFWSCIWLFWLISPLTTAWSHHSGVGVGVIVAFAMTYVAHFSRRGWIFSDHPEATHRVREDTTGASITRYSTMVALAVLAMMTVGQPGAACLVFTGIAAMWTFDIGPALAVSIVTGCSYALLWHTLDGWRADYGSLIGMCFGTVACMAGRLSAARKWALDASREENALLLVQDERNRMARDLHDILGHSLTVITMKTELAGKLVDADPEAAKRQIAEVEQLARGALADVRTTVSGYREMSLSGELARARRAFADAGIDVTLPAHVDDVAPDLRELFAWGVREATTNVIRHSGATHVTVTLTPTCLTISDDGRGATTPSTDGNGLAGLRERAASVGARVTTHSGPGFTLSVHAQPLSDGVAGPPAEPLRDDAAGRDEASNSLGAEMDSRRAPLLPTPREDVR